MSKEKGHEVPKIVALEVLEKNGVGVKRLQELITKVIGAEFTSYYYYTILRMHCTGPEGEGIQEVVEDVRIEGDRYGKHNTAYME
jgi:ferritin-like protein